MSPMPTCPVCGNYSMHTLMMCPDVLTVEFHPNGTLRSITKRDKVNTPWSQIETKGSA